eukprot:5551489-Amphidinium_carterae.1
MESHQIAQTIHARQCASIDVACSPDVCIREAVCPKIQIAAQNVFSSCKSVFGFDTLNYPPDIVI